MEIFFDVQISRAIAVGADQDLLLLLVPLILQQALYRLAEGEGLPSPVGADDEEGREGEGGGEWERAMDGEERRREAKLLKASTKLNMQDPTQAAVPFT